MILPRSYHFYLSAKPHLGRDVLREHFANIKCWDYVAMEPEPDSVSSSFFSSTPYGEEVIPGWLDIKWYIAIIVILESPKIKTTHGYSSMSQLRFLFGCIRVW